MKRLLSTLAAALVLLAPVSAASVDGIAIHSSATGTGAATVVFVHGWTCDSSSWAAQVPVFAGKYRVITVDAGTATVPDASKTKEIFPNYEATQIAGTGHFVMMEKPEEFNRVLTAFLDKIKF